MNFAFWIPVGAVAAVPLWGIFAYNRLVSLRNDVRSAWHQIDVQLKRRYDLIPNLVSVVKGYMEYERDTLERVTNARARALSENRGPARHSPRESEGFSLRHEFKGAT